MNICKYAHRCEAIVSKNLSKEELEKRYWHNHVESSPSNTEGIYVIGLYPGWKEVKEQENATGRTGMILRNQFIKAMNYHRYVTGILDKNESPYLFFSNVVRCRPKRNIDEKKLEKACITCSDYTSKEIETQKPLGIVPSGVLSAKYFLKKKYSSIKTQRGKYTRNEENYYKYKYNGIPIIPTWNTARCVRSNKISTGINIEAQIRIDIQEAIYAWKREKEQSHRKFIPASGII